MASNLPKSPKSSWLCVIVVVAVGFTVVGCTVDVDLGAPNEPKSASSFFAGGADFGVLVAAVVVEFELATAAGRFKSKSPKPSSSAAIVVDVAGGLAAAAAAAVVDDGVVVSAGFDNDAGAENENESKSSSLEAVAAAEVSAFFAGIDAVVDGAAADFGGGENENPSKSSSFDAAACESCCCCCGFVENAPKSSSTTTPPLDAVVVAIVDVSDEGATNPNESLLSVLLLLLRDCTLMTSASMTC